MRQCLGGQPCDRCIKRGFQCEFAAVRPRPTAKHSPKPRVRRHSMASIPLSSANPTFKPSTSAATIVPGLTHTPSRPSFPHRPFSHSPAGPRIRQHRSPSPRHQPTRDPRSDSAWVFTLTLSSRRRQLKTTERRKETRTSRCRACQTPSRARDRSPRPSRAERAVAAQIGLLSHGVWSRGCCTILSR